MRADSRVFENFHLDYKEGQGSAHDPLTLPPPVSLSKKKVRCNAWPNDLGKTTAPAQKDTQCDNRKPCAHQGKKGSGGNKVRCS